jgi:hypothetical protein
MEDEEAFEIARLRLIQPLIDLGDRADEDKECCEAEQYDRQLQRRKEFEKAIKHRGIGRFE